MTAEQTTTARKRPTRAPQPTQDAPAAEERPVAATGLRHVEKEHPVCRSCGCLPYEDLAGRVKCANPDCDRRRIATATNDHGLQHLTADVLDGVAE